MKIRHRMLASGILVLLSVTIMAFATYWGSNRLLIVMEESQVNSENARLAQEIRAAVQSIVVAQRGFLLTGKEAMLDHYQAALREFYGLIQEARARIDVPKEKERLDQLVSSFEQWKAQIAEPEIAARRRIDQDLDANGSPVPLEALSSILRTGAATNLITKLESILSASARIEDFRNEQKAQAVRRSAGTPVIISLLGALGVAIVTIVASWRTANIIVDQVGGEPADIEDLTRRVANNDPDVQSAFSPGKDTGIKASFHQMLQSLTRSKEENLRRLWVEENLNEIWDGLQGIHDEKEVARVALSKLAGVIEAGWAALYSAHDAKITGCTLLASYAVPPLPAGAPSAMARGLVFEAAVGGKPVELNDVPESYVSIRSGLGGRHPRHISIVPLVHNRRPVGVIELALFDALSVQQQLLLNHLAPRLAVLLTSIEQQNQRLR